MNAVAVATVRPWAPVRTVVPALGVREARRFLTHPMMLAGFVIWAFITILAEIQGTFVVQRFESVTTSLSFFPGILCILVGHMASTRDRRAGSLDLLRAAPGRAEERVLALCLGALGPALVALVLNLAVFTYYVLNDGYHWGETPNVWHIVQAPITVLGGSLLGIMLGTWLPSRATPMIAMVTIVGISIWLNGQDASTGLFGTTLSWADWGPYDGTIWYRLAPGSPAGHVVYLLGLCGLAVTAALLRVAERRAAVVVAGVVALALTVVGGLAQLP
jgi:hypothetical protein